MAGGDGEADGERGGSLDGGRVVVVGGGGEDDQDCKQKVLVTCSNVVVLLHLLITEDEGDEELDAEALARGDVGVDRGHAQTFHAPHRRVHHGLEKGKDICVNIRKYSRREFSV